MSVLYYSAYGQRLASSIPLPELHPTRSGPVRWRFQVVDSLPDMERSQLLGEEHIYGFVSAKLFRHAGGHRILIDDTGAYDLPDGDGIIHWRPTEDPWWDFGRSHLIGRVLATSLQLSGIITLHASAVEMEDGVIGFLAPKHSGKSTLALELFQAGASFVTDDSLAVDCGDPLVALPGIPSLRVCPGDADKQQIMGDYGDCEPGRDGKVVLPPFPEDRLLDAPKELAALYLLRSEDPELVDASVARTPVPAVPATMRLLGQAKISAMLGISFARTLLDQTVALASNVPIFDLSVVRDLERLPEVVEHLVAWHGLPGPDRPDSSR